MPRGARWARRRTTPSTPAAHACHTSAVVTALQAFFGTDNVPFSLDSRVTGTTRQFRHLHDAVDDVGLARILAGFHFRHAVDVGTLLGRTVGRYVTDHAF